MKERPIQEDILLSRISSKKIHLQLAEKAASVLVGIVFIPEVLAMLVYKLL